MTTASDQAVIDARTRCTSVGIRPVRPARPARRGLGAGTWDHPAGRPPLSPSALLGMAKQFAQRVSPWESPDGRPLAERTYELVAIDADSEVWVIHWPAGGHLQLHDHGGSAGALWVVGGTLEERYVRRDRQFDVLGSRLHRPSTGIGFDRHYIHDVRNGGSEPATSVHAYSPPMPAMTYYRPGQREYTAERTELRSDGAWES